MQQTIETMRDPISRPHNPNVLYKAGLMARMREYAKGNAHVFEAPTFDVNGFECFAEGYADADDDSDEPRPDDAAALQAMAREVFAELSRIGAKVSAWPDYAHGKLCLDDGLTSERHDPETLLATLRCLAAGAGLMAMWEATGPVALWSLDWRSLAVASESGELLL